MGRAPCCEKVGLKKGRWTAEEDQILTSYIQAHGEGSWRSLPKNAGLLRCGKSCRLRWINYLKADVKRGNITTEEEELIVRLHETLGNRWSLIAGHLPGRTDNEIKNYWNSHLSRKIYHFRRPHRGVVVSDQEPSATLVNDTVKAGVTTVSRRRGISHQAAMKKHKLFLTSLSDINNRNNKNSSGTKSDNVDDPEPTRITGKRMSSLDPKDKNNSIIGLQVSAWDPGRGIQESELGSDGTANVLEGPLDQWMHGELMWLDCLLQSEAELTERGVSTAMEETSGIGACCLDEWFDSDWGSGIGNNGENLMPWLWDTSNINAVDRAEKADNNNKSRVSNDMIQ